MCTKDLYFGQRVFTLSGPGKVEKIKEDKVQVKYVSGPVVRSTLPMKEVWPDTRYL